jgi:hypothetical protein
MLIHMSLSHANSSLMSTLKTIVLMKSFLCHYNIVITYNPCMCVCDAHHHELHSTLESEWSILKGLLNLLFFCDKLIFILHFRVMSSFNKCISHNKLTSF